MGGGARLAADLDLVWLLDSGDAARGRYGSKVGDAHEGEVGEDVGEGSVDRRRLDGLRGKSKSGGLSTAVPWTLRVGRGEGRNSPICSVSGTGSMATEVYLYALGKPGLSMSGRSHGLAGTKKRSGERREGEDSTGGGG